MQNILDLLPTRKKNLLPKEKGADFKREGDRGTTFKCRNTTVNGYFFKKVKKASQCQLIHIN